MKHLIFVYGSLKTNQRLNHLLKGCWKQGDCQTDANHTLYNLGWYPGLKKEGNTAVKGEIWEVTDDIFQYLNLMEGSAGYKLQSFLSTTKTPENQDGFVWYWLYEGTTTPEMECGDNWQWPPVKGQSQRPSSPSTAQEGRTQIVEPQAPSSLTSDQVLKHQQAFAKGL